jgi:two-component system, OmpR family, response regulator MprA
VRVLIVEDEVEVANGLARGLREAGMTADVALSAPEAISRTRTGLPYTVAILDVMLGGEIDGLEICRRLRDQQTATSVLMLTARDDIRDRLSGFDAGADDYLAKPFHFDEVLARIRALTRRQSLSPASAVVNIENVQLHDAQRRVTVDDRDVPLTRREYEVLELFMRHPSQVLTKTQIHQSVWGDADTAETGLVDAYASRVRRKLQAAGSQVTVENSRGVGYRLSQVKPTPSK